MSNQQDYFGMQQGMQAQSLGQAIAQQVISTRQKLLHDCRDFAKVLATQLERWEKERERGDAAQVERKAEYEAVLGAVRSLESLDAASAVGQPR